MLILPHGLYLLAYWRLYLLAFKFMNGEMSLKAREAARNVLRGHLRMLNSLEKILKEELDTPGTYTSSSEYRIENCLPKDLDQGGESGQREVQEERQGVSSRHHHSVCGLSVPSRETIHDTGFSSSVTAKATCRSGVSRPCLLASISPTEIIKFDRHLRTLRRLLSHIDAHITSWLDKRAECVDLRWEAAAAAMVSYAQDRDKHCRGRRAKQTMAQKRPVQWGDKDQGNYSGISVASEHGKGHGQSAQPRKPGKGLTWSWGAEDDEQPTPRAETVAPTNRTTKSKLRTGYTADDWLWEEAKEEAEEAFGKGYAYQRDSLGRRVHRL
jgi:hypothetical protein